MAEVQSAYKGNRVCYAIVSSTFYVLFKIFFSFKTYGSKKVPKESDKRGVILAPNHSSFLDPAVMGICVDRRVTFLAKEYLFKNFFVGSVLRGVGTFPIKSEKDDFRSIRDLVRLLRMGRCVCIFPEGTRSQDGNFKEPEKGIGFLAAKSNSWVVPIYIKGSYEAFPKGAKFFKPSPIKMYFGDPFMPSDKTDLTGAANPYDAISHEIMNRIKSIKDSVKLGTYQ